MKVTRNGVTIEGNPDEVIKAMEKLGWKVDPGEVMIQMVKLETELSDIKKVLEEIKSRVNTTPLWRDLGTTKKEWDYIQPVWISSVDASKDAPPMIQCSIASQGHTKAGNHIKGDIR